MLHLVRWFFLSFRDGLVDRYDEIFGDNETETELTGIANFGRKWGWHQSFYKLAQGDVTRYEAISKLNVNTCLLQLCFGKEKTDLENQQIKKSFKRWV